MFPDGQRVVSAGGLDKTVKVWDVATGECVATLEGHSDLVRRAASACITFVMIWLRRRSSALRSLQTGGASCLGRTTARSRCGHCRNPERRVDDVFIAFHNFISIHRRIIGRGQLLDARTRRVVVASGGESHISSSPRPPKDPTSNWSREAAARRLRRPAGGL